MVKKKIGKAKKGALGIGAILLACFGGLAYAKIQHVPSTEQVILKAGEKGRTNFVSSGDGFVLDGGLKVKLAGIDAPQMSWLEKNIKEQPLAEEAKVFLEQLLKGKTVQLFYAGDTRDRFDRALANVWTLTGDGE